MEKEELNLKNAKLLETKETADIYNINNKQVMKIFTEEYLDRVNKSEISPEKKVLISEKINMPELVLPDTMIYNKRGDFVGYKMPYINGKSLYDYNQIKQAKKDTSIKDIIEIFKKIEIIIKKANKNNIVMPDLATTSNILITDNGLKLIDYDGMQVKSILSDSYAYLLGAESDFYNIKYVEQITNNNYTKFTSELDKFSEITLLFFYLFDINLKTEINKITYKRNYTLYEAVEYILSIRNIDNPIIIEKILNLFDNNKKNEFIADDLEYLSEGYEIKKNKLGAKILKRK